MRLLNPDLVVERRALLEEYLLLCMRACSRESVMKVLSADLLVVGKKLGIHGSRVVVSMAADRVIGALENFFKGG